VKTMSVNFAHVYSFQCLPRTSSWHARSSVKAKALKLNTCTYFEAYIADFPKGMMGE
jgi:hypothetical protein